MVFLVDMAVHDTRFWNLPQDSCYCLKLILLRFFAFIFIRFTKLYNGLKHFVKIKQREIVSWYDKNPLVLIFCPYGTGH